MGAGVEYLLSTQEADGAWQEEAFTGTGFPKVFYLKYHLYSVYFPLIALARFQSAVESADAAPTADALAGWSHHHQEVSEALAAWRELLESGLPRLNRSLESAGLSPLTRE